MAAFRIPSVQSRTAALASLPLLCCVWWPAYTFGHPAAVSATAIAAMLVLAAQSLQRLVVRAYPTRVGHAVYAQVVALGLSVLLAFSFDRLLVLFHAGSPSYILMLTHLRPLCFLLAFLCLGWSAMAQTSSSRYRSLERALSQQSDAALLSREAELHRLRQQFQPHFLYNSLNAINSLIYISPEKAQEMTCLLSDFMRATVRQGGLDYSTLDEELRYIGYYLSIESVRFENRLTVHIENGADPAFRIPTMILQPLIENAIKFGVYGTSGPLEIQISIVQTDSSLSATIVNPFDETAGSARGTGFGLAGIRRRLYLLYNRTDLLTVARNPPLFTATVNIPQHA